MNHDTAILCVVAWGIVGALAYLRTMSSSWSGVGLALAFFLNMSLLHWFSGTIAVLPWYVPEHYQSTLIGFEISTLGIVAFAIGCFAIVPLVCQSQPALESSRSSCHGWKIFWRFLAVGIAALLLCVIGFANVPSVGAFLGGGQYFVFAAIGVGIWQCFQQRDRKRLWLLLAITPAFPLLTIMLQGFLGYGLGYAIIVVCLFISVYRPRFGMTFLAVPLAYLLLSFYVTYMRDRQALRDVVWYGASGYAERAEQASALIKNFEWFDPQETKHLDRIDSRLNYNWLVGAAEAQLELTRGFGNGETIWMAVQAMVPRAIWPDKPIRAGSMNLVNHYTGIRYDTSTTSVGMGLIFEFYVNWGKPGVFICMLIMGIIIGVADKRAGAHLRHGSPITFARWFLIGIGFLIVGGSLIEVFPGIITAIVLTAGLKHAGIFTENDEDFVEEPSNQALPDVLS